MSLNDVLFTRIVLQNDLRLLVVRWQILLQPNQSRYHRIHCRKDLCNEEEDFELKTVTFGVNCAPYLAINYD